MKSPLLIALITALLTTLDGVAALEPSIRNEVDHAMSITAFSEPPTPAMRRQVAEIIRGKDDNAAAISLVSRQKHDGRWLDIADGVTNDYSAAAWCELRRLCGGREPLKVLAIGNSFSICLHKEWPRLAQEKGTELDLGTLFIGGCSLKRHAENIAATDKDGSKRQYRYDRNFLGAKRTTTTSVQEALTQEKWDVVTIQQASHESWKRESYLPWATQVVECVRRLAPQARLCIQETWSYCKGDARICDPETGGAGSWGIDQRGMYERLHENYLWLKPLVGADGIIGVGTEIQRYREAGSGDDPVGTKGGDTIHLNSIGERLQAEVWQKFFFGE